jgi:hypothetical protein
MLYSLNKFSIFAGNKQHLTMNIEISIGEAVDKWTILAIKFANILDKDKLKNVSKELNYLTKIIPHEIVDDPMVTDLLDINKHLWKVEDDIRLCEKDNDFSLRFIELARQVYKWNDERARIKKEINIRYNSNFIEEKSY